MIGSGVMKDSLGYYVSTISKYVHTYINREVNPYGINFHQARIIRLLCDNEGINQEMLTEMMKLDKITISKLLDPLVQQGYVDKRKNEQDKRIKNLYPTESGRRLEAPLNEVLKKTTEVLEKGFSVDEKTEVRVLLNKMLDNIYEELR